MLCLWGVPYEQPRQGNPPRTTPTYYPGGCVYIHCQFTTPRWGVTCFYQWFRLCSCGTKPQHSKNHHSVMTSLWEPQCHHDIIIRTPRITGKPRFSCFRGPKAPLNKIPLLCTGDQTSPRDILGQNIIMPYNMP